MNETFLNHLTYLSSTDKELLKKSQDEAPFNALLFDQEKISQEEILATFPFLKNHPFINNAFIYQKEDYHLGNHFLFELGAYYLLEPCALMANYLLNPKEDDLLLDCCAAPGGKMIHASFMMHNKGMIVANEISKSRVNILASQVEKYGRKNIVVTNHDLLSFPSSYHNTFSKVLLDAPCSGSAMFRKNQKMEEDWSLEKVKRCSSLQKELILKAYDLLAPGGILLYSTCSFSQEEDEEVIAYLLNKRDAKLIEIPLNPMFMEGTLKGTIHLFPYLFPGEGHFFSLIRKPNNELRHELKRNKPLDQFPYLPLKEDIYSYQNHYYLRSYPYELSSLKIISNGLFLGDYDPKLGFIYSHFLGRYKNMLPYSISLSKEETLSYLEGNPIKLDKENGYYVLSYKNIPFGITKVSLGIGKNHYPKGLRKRYKNN